MLEKLFSKKFNKEMATRLKESNISQSDVGMVTIEMKQEDVDGQQAYVPKVFVRDNSLKELAMYDFNSFYEACHQSIWKRLRSRGGE